MSCNAFFSLPLPHLSGADVHLLIFQPITMIVTDTYFVDWHRRLERSFTSCWKTTRMKKKARNNSQFKRHLRYFSFVPACAMNVLSNILDSCAFCVMKRWLWSAQQNDNLPAWSSLPNLHYLKSKMLLWREGNVYFNKHDVIGGKKNKTKPVVFTSLWYPLWENQEADNDDQWGEKKKTRFDLFLLQIFPVHSCRFSVSIVAAKIRKS